MLWTLVVVVVAAAAVVVVHSIWTKMGCQLELKMFDDGGLQAFVSFLRSSH